MARHRPIRGISNRDTPTAASFRKSRPLQRGCGSANICLSSPRCPSQLAVLRGLSTAEGDHGRGTYLMRTGHPPMGAMAYPASVRRWRINWDTPTTRCRATSASGLSGDSIPKRSDRGSVRKYSPLFVGASDMPGAMNMQQGFPNCECNRSIATGASPTNGRNADSDCGSRCNPTFSRAIVEPLPSRTTWSMKVPCGS